ncbi:MAG: hypothetical protein GC134_03605 [Proteobacteria bacterium]|nr:hypothetical protein [Pseudomonadota bacterium]
MSHFPPNTFRLEPGRVVGGVCLEAPSLVIDTSDYRFSVRPAYTDQHGVKWLGALVFEFTPAHRKFRKADIKFSVRFDEKGSSRKPCLEVTDALDKLNNPTEADMASLDALQELVKLLQDNGQYRVMLNQLYDLATECYKATDEKPRGWHRLRILLNKAD